MKNFKGVFCRKKKKKFKGRCYRIRKKRLKKWVRFSIYLIFVSTTVISFSKIVSWTEDVSVNEEIKEEIEEVAEVVEVEDTEETKKVNPPENKFDPYWDYIKIPLISVDFDELKKKNKSTVGWINVSNTNINYPVVQGKDNDYYLNHSFDKSYNTAGWIYMDFRNNPKKFDKNTVIYGHSMINQSMFATLKKAIRKEWYNNKDNHIIKFSTPTENTLWQVFSTYKIKAESYYIRTFFSSDESFQEWLNKIEKRSVFDYKTTVTTDDKVLTLSSCFDTKGNRVAVHAKLIKREVR